jgi:serine protease Do
VSVLSFVRCWYAITAITCCNWTAGAQETSATAPASQPASAALDELARLRDAQQRVFRDALAAINPSIVRIDTIGGALPIESGNTPDGETISVARYRQADGPTTGVIIDADGYVVTSSFNFMRDPQVITVTLADGKRVLAKLVARDKQARIALLKITAADLRPAAWRERNKIVPGQWALTAGYGLGSKQPALSVGVVSALDRTAGMTVQTDAKCSPVNYGGPLFDVEGRVLGIIVPQAGDEDELAGVDWYDSGIGFAIHNDFLELRLPRLKNGENLERGVMGVQLDPIAVDPLNKIDGVRIAGIAAGPAKAAGIEAGDRLVGIGEFPVHKLLDGRRALARFAAGDVVRVKVVREGEASPRSVEITLLTVEQLRALQPNPESQPATGPESAPATQPIGE